MNEEKIQELLKQLFNLKYDWTSSGSHYKSDTINSSGRLQVENVIRNFLLEHRDSRIGELEAKVFMYENIIQKSTFAPMIEHDKIEDITVSEALSEIKELIEGVHHGHKFIIDAIVEERKNINDETTFDKPAT